MPSFSMAARSSTSISSPSPLERSADTLDEAFGIDDVGRLGHQLASERDAFVDRLPALIIALGGTGAAADDDDFGQRRFLLILQLGAVAVVAPRAQRRARATRAAASAS